MLVAEILQSVSEFVDCFWLRAQNHAEESALEEALGRECQHVLLGQQLLAEIYVISNVAESSYVNFNHHVHGSTATDGRDPTNL